MRAGDLTDRVTLQEPAGARDGYGGQVVAWVDRATRWATVVPLSGRERTSAPQVMAEDTIRVHLRAEGLPAFDASWQLVHEGRAYRIEGIARYPREGRVELTCSHAAAGAATS